VNECVKASLTRVESCVTVDDEEREQKRKKRKQMTRRR
jgi:hypothetical protein